MDNDLLFGSTPAFELTKSYRDDNGQMFVEGIASTTTIDQTGERMSEKALGIMAARLIGMPLREEHQKGYLNRLGEIIKADVITIDGKPALWIKAKLHDWSDAAKSTFNALKEGVKLGLSVAGKIKSGGIKKELVEHVGKYVPTYYDIEPTEVSVTDHPANLDAFDLAIAKSLYTHSQNTAARDAYDVTKQEVLQKIREEVKIMNDKTNLVSKKVNQDVANFAKEWGRDINKEMGVEKAAPASSTSTSTSTATDKAVSTPASTTSTDKGGAATTTSGATTTTDKGGATSTTSTDSTIASLLSDIASSLSTIQSSMSSTSTSTSTDKAAEEEEDELGKAVSSIQLALETIKKAAKTKAPASTSTVTPASSTSTATPVSKSDDLETVKVLHDLVAVVNDLAKTQQEIKKSFDNQPQARRSYAVNIEKKFQGHEDIQPGGYNKDVLKSLVDDKRSDFGDVHTYKTTGELPKWFQSENQ